MKIRKHQITNYALCDDCEEEHESENASWWARNHVKKTGHSVTINRMIWYQPLQENEKIKAIKE